MSRIELNDDSLQDVNGGMIFSSDHTTCGRMSNKEYAVHNYDAVFEYIKKNRFDMSEKTMIANMIKLGYLSKL